MEKTKGKKPGKPKKPKEEIYYKYDHIVVIGDSMIKYVGHIRNTQVRAYRGDTLEDLGNHVKNKRANYLKGKKIVVIHAGTNDLKFLTIEEMLIDLKILMDEIRNINPNVFICYSSIITRPVDFWTTNLKIMNFNDEVYAREDEWGFRYLRTNTVFQCERLPIGNAFANDDLHLSFVGNRRFGQYLAQHLAKIKGNMGIRRNKRKATLTYAKKKPDGGYNYKNQRERKLILTPPEGDFPPEPTYGRYDKVKYDDLTIHYGDSIDEKTMSTITKIHKERDENNRAHNEGRKRKDQLPPQNDSRKVVLKEDENMLRKGDRQTHSRSRHNSRSRDKRPRSRSYSSKSSRSSNSSRSSHHRSSQSRYSQPRSSHSNTRSRSRATKSDRSSHHHASRSERNHPNSDNIDGYARQSDEPRREEQRHRSYREELRQLNIKYGYKQDRGREIERDRSNTREYGKHKYNRSHSDNIDHKTEHNTAKRRRRQFSYEDHKRRWEQNTDQHCDYRR